MWKCTTRCAERLQEKPLQLVRIFSNDIGMKRGIEKSAVLVRRDYNTRIPQETIIRAMEERVKQGRILTTRQTPGQYHLSDMRADC